MRDKIIRVLKNISSPITALDLKKRVLGIDNIIIQSKVQEFELTLQRMIDNSEVGLTNHFKVFLYDKI